MAISSSDQSQLKSQLFNLSTFVTLVETQSHSNFCHYSSLFVCCVAKRESRGDTGEGVWYHMVVALFVSLVSSFDRITLSTLGTLVQRAVVVSVVVGGWNIMISLLGTDHHTN